MCAFLLVAGTCLVTTVEIVAAAAQNLCGEAPTFSDPAISRGVAKTVQVFAIWSGSGDSFSQLAADQYRELAEGHTAVEARLIAVALLHGECMELMRDQDPARLPWHFKDRLVGLSKIVPNFREAHALLDRIKAAEAGR